MYKDKKNQKMILGKQKISKSIDFTMVQDTTPVFLIMYRKVKIKNKQKIVKTLDFTGFTSTFEEKICVSLNGI